MSVEKYNFNSYSSKFLISSAATVIIFFLKSYNRKIFVSFNIYSTKTFLNHLQARNHFSLNSDNSKKILNCVSSKNIFLVAMIAIVVYWILTGTAVNSYCSGYINKISFVAATVAFFSVSIAKKFTFFSVTIVDILAKFVSSSCNRKNNFS